MRDLNTCQCQQCAERQRINAEGLAKMEALRKDAERYRWLREQDDFQIALHEGERLDRVIDTAMGKGEQS